MAQGAAMNKPARPLTPDPDIGPLDEHGQQIWSPEESSAVARILADPDHDRAIAEVRAEVAAGHVMTHEQHVASMAEFKRRWFAERGIR